MIGIKSSAAGRRPVHDSINGASFKHGSMADARSIKTFKEVINANRIIIYVKDDRHVLVPITI